MKNRQNFRFHLFFFAPFVLGISGLQIISVQVPEVIQNGTLTSVVLDCEYRYEQYETEGLEIKWFWNDEPEAVYQWIPGKKPEALGIFRGRVNLAHRASKDKYSLHRALEIVKPSTDLSGVYTCRISSFHDEEISSNKLLIYAPARNMNLTHEKQDLISVRFLCTVTSVYPEPVLKLLLLNEKHRTIEPTHFETFQNADGSFNASIEATILDKKLPKETLLQCLLELPGTKYRIRRQLVYFPGYRSRGYMGLSNGCCSYNCFFQHVTAFFLIFLSNFLISL